MCTKLVAHSQEANIWSLFLQLTHYLTKQQHLNRYIKRHKLLQVPKNNDQVLVKQIKGKPQTFINKRFNSRPWQMTFRHCLTIRHIMYSVLNQNISKYIGKHSAYILSLSSILNSTQFRPNILIMHAVCLLCLFMSRRP